MIRGMTRLVIALASALSLAACAAPADKAQQGTVKSDSTLKVGGATDLDNGHRVVLHGSEDNVPGDGWVPDPGKRFIAFDVEGCAGDRKFSLTPGDFELKMPDNTRVGFSVGIKEPALDVTDVLPGDCARGWVTYQIPAGDPASMIYAAAVRWDLT